MMLQDIIQALIISAVSSAGGTLPTEEREEAMIFAEIFPQVLMNVASQHI